VHGLDAEIKQWANDLMRAGIAEAEAMPPGDPSLLFDHAHVTPLPSFASDLEDLRGG
jgi:hypothetical protein